MIRRTVLVATIAAAVLTVHVEAASVKKLKLSAGYEAGSVISRPVLDASGVAPLAIAGFREAYDKKQNVFRRMDKVVIGAKGFTIDKKLDLGAGFAEALRAEAPKMGLATGPGGWKIGGEIREIYSDFVPPSAWSVGVLLFYTSMTVKFELESPSGERSETTQRLLGYFVSGGDAIHNALARQMVFAAQDALARLNASTFKAPPHASVAAMTDELRAKSVESTKDLSRMVGLSGSRNAVGVLLEKLGQEKDAGDRSYLIEALAAIGSPEAADALSARYHGEDEDNRLATLKVYEYVGTADARRLAQQAFDKESHKYLKQLAGDVANGAPMRGPLSKK